jgi:NAD dependent epimerase/dehydratase family enzyme
MRVSKSRGEIAMRILITGGTGLIGRPLCKALLAEGHQLTVLSRHPETVAVKCGAIVRPRRGGAEPSGAGVAALNLLPQAAGFASNVSEVRSMASLDDWHPEQTFDAVINLAGEPIVDAWWSVKRKQVLRNSRIALTETLVQRIAAAKQRPEVLLSGSAVGFYGNGGDRDLYESSSAGSDYSASLCRDWESAALAAKASGVRPRHGAEEPMGAGVAASHLLPQTASSASNVSKVRVCLLRTGLVLSKSGGLLGKMLLPFKLCMGARLGNGKQWMSWVHIDDYVAMVLRLLQDEKLSGPFNMTAPNPVTNAEFTRVLAHALHRPAFFTAPEFMLRLAMGERAALMLEGQRALRQI